MKDTQANLNLKSAILEQAEKWLGEKGQPFVAAKEFAQQVAVAMSSDFTADELLSVVLDCGFPCVRGDNGERVLWLRPTKSGSVASSSFVPTEAVRQFAGLVSPGERAA